MKGFRKKSLHLFQPVLDGWASWGRVFCDAAAFGPLALTVLRREGLAPVPPAPLTPGTNAVFRCGDVVMKVFAPKESGIDSLYDFDVERAVLGHAARAGIPAPALLASGEIADRYLFRYLIMAYVDGCDAGDALPGFSQEQKLRFVEQILSLMERLNRPVRGLLPERDIVARARGNFRLDKLPEALRRDFLARVDALAWPEDVLLHGDLTGENVRVRPDGTIALIDFADCATGPWFYELPPLVFELLRCDRVMVRALADGLGLAMDDFLGALMDGLALHNFGPDILLGFAEREGLDIGEMEGLDDVRARLAEMLM